MLQSFNYTDELNIIRIQSCFPTSIPPTKSVAENCQIQVGEVVIKFTLYTGLQRQQDVDLLGSQTLRDLGVALTCGRIDKKHGPNIAFHGRNEGFYFFIEGSFYADDDVSSSSSSSSSSHSSTSASTSVSTSSKSSSSSSSSSSASQPPSHRTATATGTDPSSSGRLRRTSKEDECLDRIEAIKLWLLDGAASQPSI